jgi:hypothetical protein
MHRLAAVSFLLAPAVLAAPAPKPRPDMAVYFATRKGDAWVYDWPGPGTEVTEVVSAVRERGGQKLVTVAVLNSRGEEEPRSEWLVSPRGVFLLSSEHGRPTFPLCLFRPSLLGERWAGGTDWLRGPGAEEGTATLHGPEPVVVPAGKFQAYRVVLEVKRVGGKPPKWSRSTYWLAAGIGVVKATYDYKENVPFTVVLSSFRPGPK